MSGEQLPALQVVVPLLAAPICLILRAGRTAFHQLIPRLSL